MSASVRTALDNDLRFAIANKRLVALTYHSRTRTVEPHDYGTLRGAVRLLVYQLEGGGAKGGRGWRLLDVAQIQRCTVLERTFAGSRGAAHESHKAWDEVFARVGP